MFYSSGKYHRFAKFIELEVYDRGNYTIDEIDIWMSKYDINLDSSVIWVSPYKYMAARYLMSASQWEHAQLLYHKNPKKYPLLSINPTEGFIINESNDGDCGYLFVKY